MSGSYRDGPWVSETTRCLPSPEGQTFHQPSHIQKSVKHSGQPYTRNHPPLPNPVAVDLMSRTTDEIPYEEVTDTEVHKALFSSSSNTAAGASQINYTMLKWTWIYDGNEITMLIQWCLTKGYHPLQWHKAVAVALQKPNKPDYSQPRAYWLITLLECMGKLLEKVVAQ